jgi:hypothetical protein
MREFTFKGRVDFDGYDFKFVNDTEGTYVRADILTGIDDLLETINEPETDENDEIEITIKIKSRKEN